MRRMEIGPNRPMSIIFLHQKYVHDPKVWPIMNTAVANNIKILANTLLTQIESPHPGCFGRGSLRLWVISAKFWSELIRPFLMGPFGCDLFRPWVVSARGGGGGGYAPLFCICWLGPSIYCLPNKKYQNSRHSQINM